MSPESRFAAAQLTVVSDERTAQVREQARVAGYAAGWAAGTRAAATAAQAAAERVAQRAAAEQGAVRAQAEQGLAALDAAARAVQARTLPVLLESQETIVRLALDLARAVLGAELADDERSARAALARALAVPEPRDVVRVRMNAEDVALVATLTDAPVPDGVEVVADPTLARGDAISELPGGYLDARLATAAERLTAAVEEALAAGEPLIDQARAAGPPLEADPS